MVRPYSRRPGERRCARAHSWRHPLLGTLLPTLLIAAIVPSLHAQGAPDTFAVRTGHPARAAAPPPSSAPMTLQQAIAIAQHRGLDAQAARHGLEAARWRDQAFHAQFLPQLSFDATLPNLSRAIIPVVQPQGATLFAPQSQMQSSLGLTLSQEIPLTGTTLTLSSDLRRVDIFGNQAFRTWQSTPIAIGIRQSLFQPNTLEWDRREQTLQSDIAERTYVEAQENVAVNTATAFFALYAARMARDNAASNVAVNDTLYTISKGRFQVGKIGENDLLQSELAELRARNELDSDQLDYERKLAAFKLLLNIPADSDVTVIAPLEIPEVDVDTALAVSEALHNGSQAENVDLQELDARRRVNQAELSNSFSAQISAQAGYNQTAPVFRGAYQSLLDQETLTLSVSMPIIQWGAHHANVEAALASQKQLASQATSTRESIAQQAHFAALQLMQSQRQVSLAAKADTVGEKRFEVAKDRYLIGKIGISDLYIAQNEKDQARVAYVQALQGFWLAYYQLRKLTLYDFATHQRISAVSDVEQ